jgi:hypothetical protein
MKSLQVNDIAIRFTPGGDIPDNNDRGSQYHGLDSGLWATSMAEQSIMHMPNVIADLKPDRAYAGNDWGLPLATHEKLKANTLDGSPIALDASDVIARFTGQVRQLAGYIPGSG